MSGTPKPALLLVEDDPNDVLLFKRAFTKLGRAADLMVAPDAFRAEQLLTSESSPRTTFPKATPNLILLDMKLPGQTGLELLAWIRAREGIRRRPVVIFSSSSEPKDLNRAYALGANSYVIKPTGFEALLETVKRLCEYWLELNQVPETEAI